MFDLVFPFAPAGDQPQAIAKLTGGLRAGVKHQVLLGVSGSGKAFPVANVLAQLNQPALILSHSKTLAVRRSPCPPAAAALTLVRFAAILRS